MLLIFVFLFASNAQAQSKKPVKGKQTAVKTAEKSAKDAKKDSKSKKETATAKSKNDPKSKADQSKKDSKSAKSDDKNSKNSKKAREEAARIAEAKRAEEARRRAAEEVRRQAILAEKRRREQAAREARERALAFERGLRTTTVSNISNDNTEGEDLQVRRAAINALGNHAGTVVVMEAQTGKILTIVNQDWAIRNSYRPCSTVKLVTAVAGLNENVINSDGIVGNFRMNLDDALAFSNNAYFQKVGVNIGNDRVIEYARALGLGEPTGINDQGEVGGKLPYNNSNARIYSHGD
ncbi:MAG TPA: penicillin-binding transpeptidase domain-containing protein, partial [Pyrinomonadaceae bacterium]|nr:penicillin-binding transpeptidase domain-containing protein [Pyrinomonadaceae bacterium]